MGSNFKVESTNVVGVELVMMHNNIQGGEFVFLFTLYGYQYSELLYLVSIICHLCEAKRSFEAV